MKTRISGAIAPLAWKRPGARAIATFVGVTAAAVAGWSAPLARTTAVHTRPDASAPTITFLKAGAEPAAAPGGAAGTPAGWMAVEVPGPFEGYVENKDLTKSLDVKPGAPIRVAPKPDAGVLAHGEKDDKTTITGLQGRWTQVSLAKNLVGYINVGGAAGNLPPIATTPAAAAPAQPPPLAPAPVTPGAYGTAEAGRPAPTVALGSSSLPRQFAGRFVSTRHPLRPRRPYEYALNDNAGKRYTYLDVSKLLLTDQIEKYIGKDVVVFGTARTTPGSNELVVAVETLQLK